MSKAIEISKHTSQLFKFVRGSQKLLKTTYPEQQQQQQASHKIKDLHLSI